MRIYPVLPLSDSVLVPDPMPTIPESLPDGVKRIIAGGQQMMQNISYKLGIPASTQYRHTEQPLIYQPYQRKEISASFPLRKAPVPIHLSDMSSEYVADRSADRERSMSERNHNNNIAVPIPLVPGSNTSYVYQKKARRDQVRVQTAQESGTQMFHSMTLSDPNQPRATARSAELLFQPVRPVLIGHYDTQSIAYHYATTLRDNAFFTHPCHPQDPNLQLDMALETLDSLKHFNANDIHPDLWLSCASKIVHQSHQPLQHGLCSGEVVVDRNTSTPFTLQTRTLASPFRSPPQSNIATNFHHIRLLTDVRTKSHRMHQIRRGRTKYRLDTAVACSYEVHWREQSRGRYILDNDDNLAGAYQETNRDGTILRILGKLGFRREGVFNPSTKRFELPEEQQEDQKWRTIDEWRAVLVSGGAELDERERRELGLDQMNGDRGEDEVRAALQGEDKWDVDVRAALGDVPLESVVLDNNGKLKGLVVGRSWD